jgi:hypothetical protein
MLEPRLVSPTVRRHRDIRLFSFHVFSLCLLGCFAAGAPCAQAQAAPPGARSVTIVLPPRVVAGRPATLAVFGVDGRLASGTTVELGTDQHVKTDASGRAYFTAPSGTGVLLARASGASAAALVDAEAPGSDLPAIQITPNISVKDRFSICGGMFRGDADANGVQLNDEPALILASSPECLVVLPGPKAKPGPARIAVETAGQRWSGSATLVSLAFDPPEPALQPGKKSSFLLRVEGSLEPLRIAAENQTPVVLRFLRGDDQELRTSGGTENVAAVQVQAIRSGDFSFHARLLPSPDPDAAERYLRAAEPLAPKELRHTVKGLADRLAHHPRDAEKVRQSVRGILSRATAGDFRTLLDAARAALE